MGVFHNGVVCKGLALAVAFALLMPSPPVLADDNALAPASLFEREEKTKLAFPVTVTHFSDEPTEELFRGRMQNVEGVSHWERSNFIEEFFPMLVSFGRHAVGSEDYEANTDQERYYLQLLSTLRHLPVWQSVIGEDLVAGEEDEEQLMAWMEEDVLPQHPAEIWKSAMRPFHALIELTSGPMDAQKREAAYAAISALSAQERTAAMDLLAISLAFSRLDTAVSLWETLEIRAEVPMESVLYGSMNEKTIVRFLVSLADPTTAPGEDYYASDKREADSYRAMLQATGLPELLEADLTKERRDEILRGLQSMSLAERVGFVSKIGRRVRSQQVVLRATLFAILRVVHSFSPDMVPRGMAVTLVLNAPHPVMINRDSKSLEINVGSLQDYDKISLVSFVHDIRHYLFSEEWRLRRLMEEIERFPRAVEEIVNILLDHEYFRQYSVQAQAREFLPEFYRQMNNAGGLEYVEMMAEMSQQEGEERIRTVVDRMISDPTLRARVEDITRDDREALVEQVRDVLLEIAHLPTQEKEIYRQLATLADKIVGEEVTIKEFRASVHLREDWSVVLEEASRESGILDRSRSLKTIELTSIVDRQWIPSQDILDVLVRLVGDEDPRIAAMAVATLKDLVLRQGFDNHEALLGQLLEGAQIEVDSLRIPGTKEDMLRAPQGARAASGLVAVAAQIMQDKPELAQVGAHRALLDIVLLRSALVFQVLQEEREEKKERGVTLDPFAFNTLLTQILATQEHVLPFASEDTRQAVLQKMLVPYQMLLNNAIGVINGFSEKKGQAARYGFAVWARHFLAVIQNLHTLSFMLPAVDGIRGIPTDAIPEEPLARAMAVHLTTVEELGALATQFMVRIDEEVTMEGDMHQNYSMEDLISASRYLAESVVLINGIHGRPFSEETQKAMREAAEGMIHYVTMLDEEMKEKERTDFSYAYGTPAIMRMMDHCLSAYKVLTDLEPSLRQPGHTTELQEAFFTVLETAAAPTNVMRHHLADRPGVISIGGMMLMHDVAEMAEIQRIGTGIMETYASLMPDYDEDIRHATVVTSRVRNVIEECGEKYFSMMRRGKGLEMRSSLESYGHFLEEMSRWVARNLGTVKKSLTLLQKYKGDRDRAVLKVRESGIRYKELTDEAVTLEEGSVATDENARKQELALADFQEARLHWAALDTLVENLEYLQTNLPGWPQKALGLAELLINDLESDRGIVDYRLPHDVAVAVYEVLDAYDTLVKAWREHEFETGADEHRTHAVIARMMEVAWQWFHDGVGEGDFSQKYSEGAVLAVGVNLQNLSRTLYREWKLAEPPEGLVTSLRRFTRHREYMAGRFAAIFLEEILGEVPEGAPVVYAQGIPDIGVLPTVATLSADAGSPMQQAAALALRKGERDALAEAFATIQRENPLLYELYSAKPVWRLDIVEGFFKPVGRIQEHHVVLDRRLLAEPNTLAFLLTAEWVKDLSWFLALEAEVVGLHVLARYWSDDFPQRDLVEKTLKESFEGGEALIAALERFTAEGGKAAQYPILKEYVQDRNPRLRYDQEDAKAELLASFLPDALMGDYAMPEGLIDDPAVVQKSGTLESGDGPNVRLIGVVGDHFLFLASDEEGNVVEISMLPPGSQHTWESRSGNTLVYRIGAFEFPLRRTLRDMTSASELAQASQQLKGFIDAWFQQEVQSLGMQQTTLPAPQRVVELIGNWQKNQEKKLTQEELYAEVREKGRILCILSYLHTLLEGGMAPEQAFVLNMALERLKNAQPDLMARKLGEIKHADLLASGLRGPWAEELMSLSDELFEHEQLWASLLAYRDGTLDLDAEPKGGVAAKKPDKGQKRRGKARGAPSKKKAKKKSRERTLDEALPEAVGVAKKRLNERYRVGKRDAGPRISLFGKPDAQRLMEDFQLHRLPPKTEKLLSELRLAGRLDSKMVANAVVKRVEELLQGEPAHRHGDVLIALRDQDFLGVTFEQGGMRIPLAKALAVSSLHWSEVVLRQYRRVTVARYSVGRPRRLAKWMFAAPIPGKWTYASFGRYERELYDAIQAFTELLQDYSLTEQDKHHRQQTVPEAGTITREVREAFGERRFQPQFFELSHQLNYIPGLAAQVAKAGIDADDINEALFGMEKVDYANKVYRQQYLRRTFDELREEGRIETILDMRPADLADELYEVSKMTFPDLLMEAFLPWPLQLLGITEYPQEDHLHPFMIAVPERWERVENRMKALGHVLSVRGKAIGELEEQDFRMAGFSDLLEAVRGVYSAEGIGVFLKEHGLEDQFVVEGLTEAAAKVPLHHLLLLEAGMVPAEEFDAFQESLSQPSDIAAGEWLLLGSFARTIREEAGWQEFQRLIHLASRQPTTPDEKEANLERARQEIFRNVLVREKMVELALQRAQQDFRVGEVERVRGRQEPSTDFLRLTIPNHFQGSILYLNPGDIIEVIQDDGDNVSLINEAGEIVDNFEIADSQEDRIVIDLTPFRKLGHGLPKFWQHGSKIRVVKVAEQKGEIMERGLLQIIGRNLARHGKSLDEESRFMDELLRVESPRTLDLRAAYGRAQELYEEAMRVGRLGTTPYHQLEIFQGMEAAPSQKAAVLLGLMPGMPLLLHGPPGTGKTTVIAATILLHFALGQKVHNKPVSILVASQANTAVDNVLSKLIDIYKKAGLEQGRMPFRRVAGNWEKVEKGIDQFFRLKPGKADAAKFISKNPHHVIFATNMGTVTNANARERTYDIVIVDEATKANLGESLAPFVALQWDEDGSKITGMNSAVGGKLIIVGDHRQLPPYSLNEDAVEAAGLTEDEAESLGQSLFEVLMEEGKDQVLLSRNYRSRPPIAILLSRLFYDGAVLPRAWAKDGFGNPVVHERTFTLVDTTQRRGYEPWTDDPELLRELQDFPLGEEGRRAISNNLEARLVVDQLDGALKRGRKLEDILVIPPYNAQVELMRRLLAQYLEKWYQTNKALGEELRAHEEYKKARTIWMKRGGDVKHFEPKEEFFAAVAEGVIKTVDSSQGLENKVVIMPFTRSNRDGIIGFLNNLKRLNVGLSRGQEELIVIGDGDTLRQASRSREDVRARKVFEKLWDYEGEFKELVDQYKMRFLGSMAAALGAEPGDLSDRLKLFLDMYGARDRQGGVLGDRDAQIFRLVNAMKDRMDEGINLNISSLKSLAEKNRVQEGSLDWFIALWLLYPAQPSHWMHLADKNADPSLLEAISRALRALPENERRRQAERLLESKKEQHVRIALGLVESLGETSLVQQLLATAEAMRAPPLLAKRIRLTLNNIPATPQGPVSFDISRRLYDKMRFTRQEPVHGLGILLKGGITLKVLQPPRPLVEAGFSKKYEEFLDSYLLRLSNLRMRDEQTRKTILRLLNTDAKAWSELLSLFKNIDPLAEDLRMASETDWAIRMLACQLALRRVISAPVLKGLGGKHVAKIGVFMERMQVLTEVQEFLSWDQPDVPQQGELGVRPSLTKVSTKVTGKEGLHVVARVSWKNPETGDVVSFEQPLPFGVMTVGMRIEAEDMHDGRLRLSHGFKPELAELGPFHAQAGTGKGEEKFTILEHERVSPEDGMANVRRWLEDRSTQVASFRIALNDAHRLVLEGVGGRALALQVPRIKKRSKRGKKRTVAVWVVPAEDPDYGLILQIFDPQWHDANTRAGTIIYPPILELTRRKFPDGTFGLINAGEQAFSDYLRDGRPFPRRQHFPESHPVVNGMVRVGDAEMPVPLPNGSEVVLVKSDTVKHLDILIYEKSRYLQEFREIIGRGRREKRVAISEISPPVAVFRGPTLRPIPPKDYLKGKGPAAHPKGNELDRLHGLTGSAL